MGVSSKGQNDGGDDVPRGLTTRDIGKLLGLPHSTVQNIERRALEKMRKAMDVGREDVLDALAAFDAVDGLR